jgi:hypothetical protein
MAARGYAVSLIAPAGYAHSEGLREAAQTITLGMRAARRDCVPADNLAAPERRNIVLGAHLVADRPDALPADASVYNLEQIDPDSPWCGPAMIEQLRRHAVRDYSERNRAALAMLGARDVRAVPLGGCP